MILNNLTVCPICNKPLKPADESGANVLDCPICKGIWVPYEDEKKVLQMVPEVFTVDELHRLRRFYEPLQKTEKVRYRPCPVCQELMRRKTWGSHSGVVVDKCEIHGTWYEDGELDKIREYIKTGGVEYEKLRLTEHGLSYLDSRLTQEVTRLHKKIDSAYMRARLYSMMGL